MQCSYIKCFAYTYLSSAALYIIVICMHHEYQDIKFYECK